MVTLGIIPDPNLSFSLTELKNDRFRDVLPSKMVIFAFFGQNRTHTLVACLLCVTRKISLREQKSRKMFWPTK